MKSKVEKRVVYLLIPTSNHNLAAALDGLEVLYIFWFLHQTTTIMAWVVSLPSCISFDSYIKPQLVIPGNETITSCISFDSYIKPQQPHVHRQHHRVVYLLIPTSNHNCSAFVFAISWVVYLLIPTSNHNYQTIHRVMFLVVYLLIPTSNHNSINVEWLTIELYIFWFLHQTTTKRLKKTLLKRCISFDSYIKPQPTDLNILIFSA